ncbi:MAG TPA: zinc ABC transporter substrate-binding protein, partial [Mariniphaga sp.]|nr:zinc ABC transporter substrate-binding protein [Mariniphaga sp.]
MANKFINDHFLNKFKASAHQMKKFLLFFVVTTTLASCNFRNQKQDENEKPVVTVSIIPLKTFVEEIAGDDFTIQVLVPQGASPETYSLLPSQLKQISQSKAWFRLGFLEFELALWQKLQQINRNMKVVDLSENLNLIVGKEIKHGDHV